MFNVQNERLVVATNTKTYLVKDVCKLNWLHVDYTSTAIAGNRQLRVQILDPSGAEYLTIHAGAVQAASLVRHYEFFQGSYRETTFIDNSLQVSGPQDLVLLPNWSIVIKDNANIAAGDSMIVTFQLSLD